MTLEEFIKIKQEELEKEYREVVFDYAESVGLQKNGVTRQFLSNKTNMDKKVKEVELNHLPEQTLSTEENGSLVVFKVKAPRKRKFNSVEFHALWEED